MPDPQAQHEAVVAFLSDPKTHGIDTPVAQRRTHGALVFLAGDLAYKIKRPVRYDYLDFSTRDRRRAMLARELDLNQPAAPALYLDLVPITRSPAGERALGGDGPAVDWALQLRRFAQDAELGRVAERGGLDDRLAAALGRMVARYHGDARPHVGADGAARMRRVVTDLTSGLAAMEEAVDADTMQALRAALDAEVAAHGPLLRARAAAGHVRRCHGDLHLGNIVLLDGTPVPFDALEFSERLATTDVLYDLAFLLMDLRHRGLEDQANVVLGRYLQHADIDDHFAGLAAMRLFLALRALVRALVTVQRARLAQGDDAAAALDDARRYVADARSDLRPVPPVLVAVGGLSGTGKSTLATALAPRLGAAPGAVHLRSDVARKVLFAVAETTKLPQSAYTPAVSARIYRSLQHRAECALAAGQSVVLDAVHSSPDDRHAAAAAAATAGVPFLGLWLQATETELVERVNARTGDPSDADAAVVRRQLRDARAPAEWVRIDASGDAQTTLMHACAVLEAHGIGVAPRC